MLKRERQRTEEAQQRLAEARQRLAEARQERAAQRKLYDARIDELLKANREERRQHAAMQQAMLDTIIEMANTIIKLCRQNRTPRNPNPPSPPQP